MAAIYDATGMVIGDDGAGDMTAITQSDVGVIAQKMIDFQQSLYDVDDTYQNLVAVQWNSDLPSDDPLMIALQAQLDEYDAKKGAFKFTADSYNTLAGMANAVGAGMTALSIPSGLGFAPLVLWAGGAAALVAVGVAIDWAHNWITVSYNVATQAALSIQDQTKRDAALVSVANIAAKNAASAKGPGIATILQLGMILGIAYLAFRMTQKGK